MNTAFFPDIFIKFCLLVHENSLLNKMKKKIDKPHCTQTNNVTNATIDYFFFIFVFLFSLKCLSRLFHSYKDESIGSWGETAVPRENHLTHPQAEHGLSHMWPVRGSNLPQSQG